MNGEQKVDGEEQKVDEEQKVEEGQGLLRLPMYAFRVFPIYKGLNSDSNNYLANNLKTHSFPAKILK